MKKGFLLLLAVSLFLGMAMVNVPVAFSQWEESVAVKEAESATGEVVSIGTQESSMVVKYLINKELQNYQTATFYFSDATEIKKGEEVLKFADLKAGDKITLRYTEENLKRTVVSLVVE